MSDIGEELLEKIRADFALSTKQLLKTECRSQKDIEKLSEKLGQALSVSVRKYVKPENLPDGRLYYNIADTILRNTLHDSYELINGIEFAVQKEADKITGLNIEPQKATFPDERVNSAINAVSVPDISSELLDRRLDSPIRNIVNSFHVDYVENNAEFRSNAGIKCYITRNTDGKCCPWCTSIAGRYEYGKEPSNIYRRHDNCTCSVTFENGRERQNVWSKRKWEVKDEFQPKVFSRQQAEQIQSQNLNFRGLTNGENSDKINLESELGKFKQNIINDNRMSKEYYSALKNKFSHGSDNAKALFNKYTNGNSVVNADYMGTAFFNPDNKKICMSYYADLNNERGECATWFHEHGHLIDNAMNNVSNNKEFRQCLSNDWLSYMKSYGKEHNIKTFDKVQTAISGDLNSMRKHSAVSDILEGVSKCGIQGCAGHGENYWKDDSIICAEAFAHMFESQFDKIRYAEMQKYFPSALSKFEEMIKVGVK